MSTPAPRPAPKPAPRYPRVQRLIAWLEEHQTELETAEKFSLTLHFGGTSTVVERTEKFPLAPSP